MQVKIRCFMQAKRYANCVRMNVCVCSSNGFLFLLLLPSINSLMRSRLFCTFKQLIFSGEYTKAMNKDWHSGHFCCWQCDESLTGQRYVLRDDHPYCIKCYENVFANTCDECNKIIGIDSKVTTIAVAVCRESTNNSLLSCP